MIELLDYWIKILSEETENDELKNKLRYIKSLIEANKTLNDVNLSFTEKEIKLEDRCNYYIGNTATMMIDGNQHNDSRYTVEEFSKKYGQIWILGKMDSKSGLTLSEAMSKRLGNCIAPPDKANINIKKFGSDFIWYVPIVQPLFRTQRQFSVKTAAAD